MPGLESQLGGRQSIVVWLLSPVSDDAARVPGLILLPTGLSWMILAIAVDNSLDPGRVCKIDIENHREELTDAGTVVAKCRYRSHMIRTRAVCQEFSELICCRAVTNESETHESTRRL